MVDVDVADPKSSLMRCNGPDYCVTFLENSLATMIQRVVANEVKTLDTQRIFNPKDSIHKQLVSIAGLENEECTFPFPCCNQ